MQYTHNCIEHLFWLYNNHASVLCLTVKVAIKRGNLHSLQHVRASASKSRLILKSHKSTNGRTWNWTNYCSEQCMSNCWTACLWTTHHEPASLHDCHAARSYESARCSKSFVNNTQKHLLSNNNHKVNQSHLKTESVIIKWLKMLL